MREAHINNFDEIWNKSDHFFTTHYAYGVKEGDEYAFISFNKTIKAIVSEIKEDKVIWEIITKEAT